MALVQTLIPALPDVCLNIDKWAKASKWTMQPMRSRYPSSIYHWSPKIIESNSMQIEPSTAGAAKKGRETEMSGVFQLGFSWFCSWLYQLVFALNSCVCVVSVFVCLTRFVYAMYNSPHNIDTSFKLYILYIINLFII